MSDTGRLWVKGDGYKGKPEPYITIVVPTISERAQWLTKCLNGYHMTTGAIRTEVLVIRDKPTCAVAWNEGIERAQAPYIHLTADDIVPHPGWWEAGERAVLRGETPSAKILNTDGSLQSCGDTAELTPNGTVVEIARIPFALRETFECIGPFPEDMHYYTDNWFSYQARCCGVPSVVHQDYLFTHHLAPERREMADERLHSDGVKFKERTRG